MSALLIKESVESVIEHYSNNPDEAEDPGIPVKAVMEEGLRCRVELLDGTEIVKTDMPTGIGGGGSALSPVGDSVSRAIPTKVVVKVV